MSTTPNARDIAEEILSAEYNDETNLNRNKALARAYLELEKENKRLTSFFVRPKQFDAFKRAEELFSKDLYEHAERYRLCIAYKSGFESSENYYQDEIAKLKEELEYYKEMELRYNQLLEETSNEAWLNMQNRIIELTTAINRIGMLGSSEHAYTSEFTTKVVGIVREALK